MVFFFSSLDCVLCGILSIQQYLVGVFKPSVGSMVFGSKSWGNVNDLVASLFFQLMLHKILDRTVHRRCNNNKQKEEGRGRPKKMPQTVLNTCIQNKSHWGWFLFALKQCLQKQNVEIISRVFTWRNGMVNEALSNFWRVLTPSRSMEKQQRQLTRWSVAATLSSKSANLTFKFINLIST